MLPMPTLSPNLDKGDPAPEDALTSQNGVSAASGKKKRLAFVIAHLGPGGAQRVVVNAANALVARGFDVHVTILGHRPIVYWIDPRIVFHSSSPVTAAFPASDAGSLDDELEQIAPVKTEGGEFREVNQPAWTRREALSAPACARLRTLGRPARCSP